MGKGGAEVGIDGAEVEADGAEVETLDAEHEVGTGPKGMLGKVTFFGVPG